jgi:effector-binding domain-containing protein
MAASAFSTTDDAAAEQAYGAIRKWMSTRGFALAGAKREIYLDHEFLASSPKYSGRI